jgi:hypothetical protein
MRAAGGHIRNCRLRASDLSTPEFSSFGDSADLAVRPAQAMHHMRKVDTVAQ